jgi:hypothetical protein
VAEENNRRSRGFGYGEVLTSSKFSPAEILKENNKII